MNKNYLLSLLCVFSLHTPIKPLSNEAKVAIGITTTVLCSYATVRTYSALVVGAARARFAPESEILARYHWYAGHEWTAADAQALQQELINNVVYLHNQNRDKWTITVMVDLISGRPALQVNDQYRLYPLLQYVQDLDFYIGRLKAFHLLHLHPSRDEIAQLIDQLTYVRTMISSCPAHSLEEQHAHIA